MRQVKLRAAKRSWAITEQKSQNDCKRRERESNKATRARRLRQPFTRAGSWIQSIGSLFFFVSCIRVKGHSSSLTFFMSYMLSILAGISYTLFINQSMKLSVCFNGAFRQLGPIKFPDGIYRSMYVKFWPKLNPSGPSLVQKNHFMKNNNKSIISVQFS